MADRLIQLLQKLEGISALPFNLAGVRAQADPTTGWYVVLLSSDLGREQRKNLDALMESYPDRVLPVLARDCSPEAVHPRFAFLDSYDLRDATDQALNDLRRMWQRQGIGRDRAGCSITLFLSLKGGVAKTTSTVAVAEYLAEQGNRVLVIDTDHQCGASALLLGEDQLELLEDGRKTLSDLFSEALNLDFDPNRIARFAAPSRSIRGLGGRLRACLGSTILMQLYI
ncbi:ParA family protein [Fimbriiglobus ruber]|uniref:ParA family protein n=1 Tax=Fimbriiglobus ruber TaxID=1908690 RepID=UPI00137B057B|nr:AAA family ATPase [Fimbriiglobus ruber]